MKSLRQRVRFSSLTASGWVLALFFCVMAALALLIAPVLGKIRSLNKPSSSTALRPATYTQNSRIPTVITNYTRFGFEPSVFKVPPGQVLLVVRNASSLQRISLQLSRQLGNQPSQQLLSGIYEKGSKSWDRLLTLTAGEYVVSETYHPEWTCKITVSEK